MKKKPMVPQREVFSPEAHAEIVRFRAGMSGTDPVLASGKKSPAAMDAALDAASEPGGRLPPSMWKRAAQGKLTKRG